MVEQGHEPELISIGKEDPRIVALHQAASRAEEAAERLQSYTDAAQPLLSSLASPTALRVPWTAPLTPDDSAEENFDHVEPEKNNKHPSTILAPNGTPIARPATLTQPTITNPGKKRGRPRKLNLIDSIIGQGQPKYAAPANPKPKGRPPGTSKSRGIDQRPFSSSSRVLKPTPTNSEGVRIFVAGLLVDHNEEDVLSQVNTQFMSDIPVSFKKKATSIIHPHDQISRVLSIEWRKKTEAENNVLKVIFNCEIAPIMHSAMIEFEDRLPRDVLVSVGRAVSHSFPVIVRAQTFNLTQFADEILNKRLRKAVQNGLTTVTPLFKQIARGTIQRMLLQKARDHESVLFSGMIKLDSIAALNSTSTSGTDVEIQKEVHDILRPKDSRPGVFGQDVSRKEHDRNGIIQKESKLHSSTSSSTVYDWNRTQIDVPNLSGNINVLQHSASRYSSSIAPIPRRSLASYCSELRITKSRVSEPLVEFETDLRGPSSEIARKQTSTSFALLSDESTQSPTQSGYQSTHSEDSMPRRLVRHPDYIEKSISDSEATFLAPEKTRIRPPQRSRAAVSKISKLQSTAADDDLVDTSIYCVPQRVRNTTSLLSYREIGAGKCINTAQLSCQSMNIQLKMNISEKLGCWRTWTGASKDVVTTAWAPNGRTYAAGASTEMDNLNIQYNRNNNILFGDFEANTLKELPDHHIDRPTPDMVDGGDNALEDTYNAVDPELYTTVSHVFFSHDSKRLFSASYDNTVKIWDLESASKPHCVQTIKHDAHVELLTMSHQPANLLASGQRTTDNSIRIFDLNLYDHGDYNIASAAPFTYESFRAKKFNLFPTCLLWGRISQTNGLLLAGFAEDIPGDVGFSQYGDLCLWHVETGQALKIMSGSTAVHDISWHPRIPLFAAASTPGNRHNLTHRSTRSVVRTYQPYEAPSYRVEYECPALDINDIQFHPRDDHYISASCTDGATYVWDVRRPDTILHRLPHGLPIDELDHSVHREEQDTGVRFQAWDQAGQRLLTGSSDGAIKSWNIFVSPKDAFIQDIAHFDAGVMTGSFSPNYDNLLVGLSKGAVHILSVCPTTHNPASTNDNDTHSSSSPRKAYDTITYIPAPRPAVEETPSGISLAAHLLATGQLVMHPTYGVGKGPNYQGPYARHARRDGADPATEDLEPNLLVSQLDPLERRRGRKAGGKADRETVERYRMAGGLAHERNFMRYAFREGTRKAGKRDAVDGGEEGGAGKRAKVEGEEDYVGGVWWEGEEEEEEEEVEEGGGEAAVVVRTEVVVLPPKAQKGLPPDTGVDAARAIVIEDD
ncbi:hypothetical protein MMC34_007980 [Xylographa carneopallida]|nr:hypothetical protein [Xylographa carneopallida]